MSMTLRLLAPVLLLSLTACSAGGTNSRLDYKEAKSLRGLDMPPDLIAPENSGVTELPSVEAGEVLPRFDGIRVVNEYTERWLELDTPPEKLWSRLQGFWATLGLELTEDKPQLGVMETAWAENRSDAPGGFLTDWIKSINPDAYAAGTRDKYRLRLERSDTGGSEIHVTHYGLKEVVIPNNDSFGSANFHWEVRPSDPELANEVLNHLVLFLGGSETVANQANQKAEAAPERAHIEGSALVLDEGFARSWRRTGIALDRLGVVIEDRNRSQGVYYIGQITLDDGEGHGWFSSLLSDEEGAEVEADLQLQIVLNGDEAKSRLTILNMDGTLRQDKLAAELLKRLQQEMK